MNTVDSPKRFPNAKHYAIIVFDQRHIHHEGDERSRTHPGHGYPEHTETVNNFEYLAFDYTTEGRLEWKEKIKDLYKRNPNRTDVVVFVGDSKQDIQINVEISDIN